MKRILITGAHSYVGANVERWLLKEPENYQVDTLDMIDGSWRHKDFSGYDVVFHVAGIAHVNAKKNMEALYYKVNTNLTIETAQHAKQCGVKQFIFMSSIIVYGESKSLKPVIITRETEPNPNGFYGNSKLKAEIGIKELADESFKIVILRPPMIYGPGSKGNFPKLIALAKKTPIFPAYHNQRSMLYIDNLCEFIRRIINHDKSGVFFPQNEEYVSTKAIVEAIALIAKRRVWITKTLNPFVIIGSWFIPQFNKIWGSYTYSHELSKEELIYQQVVGFKDSIQQTSSSG